MKSEKIQVRADKIRKFLSRTTEPFDDWEYDGEVLIIIIHNKTIEKYSNSDLTKIIIDF